MNKLLILLLFSTPLFAEDDLVDIEDKVLANSEIEMIFMSDGNFTQELKSNNERMKGVWERDYNRITIYLGELKCSYNIQQIADTYIFEWFEWSEWMISSTGTDSKRCQSHQQQQQQLMQEMEWSKTADETLFRSWKGTELKKDE